MRTNAADRFCIRLIILAPIGAGILAVLTATLGGY